MLHIASTSPLENFGNHVQFSRAKSRNNHLCRRNKFCNCHCSYGISSFCIAYWKYASKFIWWYQLAIDPFSTIHTVIIITFLLLLACLNLMVRPVIRSLIKVWLQCLIFYHNLCKSTADISPIDHSSIRRMEN